MKYILHVGSGFRNASPLPEIYRGGDWREIRLDINPNVQPDITGDIRSMPQTASGAYDAVFSCHNLEHLYPHETPLALAEFYRVLKPGGHALISCPDLQAVAAYIAAGTLLEPICVSPAGPVSPLDMLYGHRPSLARGNAYMAHHTGFTDRTLALALAGAGFENVRVEKRDAPYFDLWALGFRPAGG